MTPYAAFTTYYNGLSNRLINEACIISNGEEMKTSSAQWDTGATITCIAQTVVDRLGLKPIGQNIIKTPSGDSIVNTYIIDLKLKNNVTVKDIIVIDSEIGAQGIDVLIGMDVIRHGDFAVTNLGGKTVFTFRTPSVESIDFVKQIQNQKNEKI